LGAGHRAFIMCLSLQQVESILETVGCMTHGAGSVPTACVDSTLIRLGRSQCPPLANFLGFQSLRTHHGSSIQHMRSFDDTLWMAVQVSMWLVATPTHQIRPSGTQHGTTTLQPRTTFALPLRTSISALTGASMLPREFSRVRVGASSWRDSILRPMRRISWWVQKTRLLATLPLAFLLHSTRSYLVMGVIFIPVMRLLAG